MSTQLSSTRRAAPTALAAAALSSRRVVIILLILDIAYVINAMDRQVFPILVKPISQDLSLNPSQFGLLSTVFTLGMGLAAIPAGFLSDRIGRKNMILAGLLIFSGATALQGVALGFSDLAVYRILSGIGEGAQNAALYSAAGVFLAKKRAFAVGTLNAGYGIGAFIGPLLGGFVLQLSGSWRVPLFVFAIIGIVVMVIVLAGVPRKAIDSVRVDKQASPEATSDTQAEKGRFFNRNIIAGAIVAMVAGFAIYGYLGLYPTFLQTALAFSPAQASLASSMFGIGALASIPIGMLADRWNQRTLNIVGLVGLMVVGGLMFSVAVGIVGQMILTILMGIFFTGTLYTNTNSFMQRSVPGARVGTAVGLFVAALYIPASVAGLVFANLEVALGWASAGLIQMVAIPAVGIVAMLFARTPEKK